jgi:steroid delta-isomerase-like uncharacterized protein
MSASPRPAVSTATPGSLRALAAEWISLWCAPVDWARFDRLHAATFADHSPAGRPADKAGFAAGLREFVAAFPDLHTTVEDTIVEAARRRVVVRWRAEGTNRGRFLGVGPTGRRTVITGIEILEVAEGRVVGRWGEWDILDHLAGGA